MPKMTPEQRKAVQQVRQMGGDADAIADAIADNAPPEEGLAVEADAVVGEHPEPESATPQPEEQAPAATEAPPTTSKPAGRARGRAAPARPSETARAANPLFTTMTDIKDYHNVLFWGREGSGKTLDALTAANRGQILVINAEGGLKRQALAAHGINLANVQVYPPQGERITDEGMEAAISAVHADLMHDPDSWFAVVIDSISEVSQSTTDYVSDDRVSKSRGRGAIIDRVDSFFVDRGDYGTAGKMVRRHLKRLRDLPVHFIVTALERRDVDDDTGKVMYGPAIPPGLQSDLLGYVDLVLHTKQADEDKDYYRALTKGSGRYRSKDRYGVLPKILVNPSVDRVLDYLDGTLVEASDPVQAVLVQEKPTETAKPATRTRASRAKPAAVAPAGGDVA